jgi:regulator of protease activity HflC (stomatin/prohibitin superfamily)
VKRNRSFPTLIFVVVLGIGAALAYALHMASADFAAIGILAVFFVVACAISSAIQVADQWSKAVVLRLGKFRSLEGPGVFLIFPLIETIPYADQRYGAGGCGRGIVLEDCGSQESSSGRG